jgi:hypothetical protein
LFGVVSFEPVVQTGTPSAWELSRRRGCGNTVLKIRNEPSYDFALRCQKTVSVLCSLGGYKSYEEDVPSDPLGRFTEYSGFRWNTAYMGVKRYQPAEKIVHPFQAFADKASSNSRYGGVVHAP